MRCWVVALLAACNYERGVLPDDAPVVIDTPKVIDGPSADARNCPAAPSTCMLVTCVGLPSCYYVCGNGGTVKYSWSGAASACASSGLGCLATIETAQEQNCLAVVAQPTLTNVVWIGYFQSPQGTEPDGGWGWKCGSSAYTSWATNEPNNIGGNEDCAAMADMGKWNDADCAGTARWLCEL